MSSLLTFENPVFVNYAYYGTLVVGKTVLMTPLITFMRSKREVFSSPEDLKLSKTPGLQVNRSDETIERIRRAHLNDIENILPFAIIGAIYVASDPDPEIARRLFRVFTIARFIHTAVYLGAVRQPSRVIASVVGVSVNLIMLWRIQYVLRFYW